MAPPASHPPREPLDDALLQRYLDGEVTSAERAEVDLRLTEDAETKRRLDAGREVGGLLRAYAAKGLEETDMATLLDGILARTRSDQAAQAEQVGAAPAPVTARPAVRPVSHIGPTRRRARSLWLGVGALAAAAAALLLFMRVSGRTKDDLTRAPTVSDAPTAETQGAVASMHAAVEASSQASIEQLDVVSSAAIFTIPDDEGAGATTVIWVSDPDNEGNE